MAKTTLLKAEMCEKNLRYPLLLTKFYMPQTRNQLINRIHLEEQLNSIFRYKLTTVCAPAGFGKSTLLSSWCKNSMVRSSVSWLALDPADNEASRFWTYFFSAIGRICSGAGENALDLLHSLLKIPVETILTTFINDITKLDGEIIIVLDDYHFIVNEDIHRDLAFLIDSTSANFHMVIVSRVIPPLPIARIRARGELVEIGVRQLRFDREEAAQFFERTMQLEVSTADFEKLYDKTEGWITGMQLAALSLRDAENAKSMGLLLSGNDRYIVDYLAEEVLHRQSESIQMFLLYTSILEHFNTELCNTVTGYANSQTIIEQLEQNNVFLIALDNARHWYRYHHYFADFLRNHLLKSNSAMLPVLYLRASIWYEEQGLLNEAIDYAFKSKQRERAVEIVVFYTKHLIMQGEMEMLQNWLARFEAKDFCLYPCLNIAKAWLMVATFNPASAEETLQSTYSILGSYPINECREQSFAESITSEGAEQRIRPMKLMLADLYAIQAIIGVFQMNKGHITKSIASLESKIEHDVFLRLILLFCQGFVYTLSNDKRQATSILDQIVRLSASQAYNYIAFNALNTIARLQCIQGDLIQAAKVCERLFGMMKLPDGRYASFSGMVYIEMGEILYEWNQLEQAQTYIEKGIELAKKALEGETLLHGYFAFVKLLAAKGEFKEGLSIIERITVLTREQYVRHSEFYVTAEMIDAFLALGRLDDALKLAKESDFEKEAQNPSEEDMRQAVIAKLSIMRWAKQGNPLYLQTAVGLAEQVMRRTEKQGRVNEMIKALVLKAVTLSAVGNIPNALIILERAVRLALPGRYVRVFLDAGSTIAVLLHKILQNTRNLDAELQEYIKMIMTFFESEGVHLKTIEPPIEALSEREMEVLQLIASGKSNAQIAQEIMVGLSTVKKHINNIYAKLNVQSRTQAIAKARELSLV